ncbi:MAG: hypothetical protein AB7F35_06175 [Acetobacteraceae bacterium]
MPRRAGLAALVFTTMAVSASAQQPTAEDAQALQRDLRGWFVNLLGSGLPLPEPPLIVTADGDAYRATLSLEDLTGRKGDAVTARIHKLADGRWSLDPLRFPGSAAFSVPTPDRASPDAMSDVAITLGEQKSRAVIDPAMNARSTLEMEFRAVEVTGTGGGQVHEQNFDRGTFRATLIPGADQRLDINQEAEIAGWKSSVATDAGMLTHMEIRRMRQNSRLEGLNRERLEIAFGAIKSMLAEAAGNGADKDATAQISGPMRTHIRTLISSLREMAARLEGEETLDNLSVEIPGVATVTLDQARFGLGADAPDGKVHAWMEVALSGPDVPDLPPSLTKYLPNRLALRPAISGVSVDRLFKLMMDATEENPDQQRLESEGRALLEDPAAQIGLESLSLEMAGVQIEGTARLRMLAPDTVGFEGRLSAAGMETLMNEAGKDAELQIAMPILVIIRGLARPDGERLVWDLAITKDQALVNGVDVMRMAAPPSQPHPRRPSR